TGAASALQAVIGAKRHRLKDRASLPKRDRPAAVLGAARRIPAQPIDGQAAGPFSSALAQRRQQRLPAQALVIMLPISLALLGALVQPAALDQQLVASLLDSGSRRREILPRRDAQLPRQQRPGGAGLIKRGLGRPQLGGRS